MTIRSPHCLVFAVLFALTGTTPVLAAENGALAKDLTATITLLGLPCGQVVSVVAQGNHDHLATCSNGSRYRVYVNAQGRVTAEKR